MVDDSVINLTIVEKGIKDHFEIVTIQSGELLFQYLEMMLPDLILLDVIMPGMDGFEVLKKLKSNDRYNDIPVILLTGRDDTNVELQGFEMGVVDFVSKPFSIPVLINRIRLHVGVDMLIKTRTAELQASHKELKAANLKLESIYHNLLLVLADIVESRDGNTGGHIYRTTKYTEVLVNAMLDVGLYAEEMAKWDIQNIIPSVALHDIGKIGTPDNVLNKPGRLTEEEFQIMKQHAQEGRKIIENAMSRLGSEKYLKAASKFAEFHHENWDGSGYPHGLKGTAIPLQGRIMAFSDVYDALVTERPYKKAFTHDEAVDIIMQDVGKKFDPAIGAIFYGIRDKFATIRKEQESHDTP